jgi:hypothetical protein
MYLIINALYLIINALNHLKYKVAKNIQVFCPRGRVWPRIRIRLSKALDADPGPAK